MLSLQSIRSILSIILLGALSFNLSAHVLGSDDRVPMLSEALPWSAIGKITIDDSRTCTATLVGKDLILTAAHCLIDQETKRSLHFEKKINFSPNLQDGLSHHEAYVTTVWLGTYEPRLEPWQDYAFARLSQPLGEIYGSLKVQSFSGDKIGPSNSEIISLASYSIDFQQNLTAGVHLNCAISGRLFENDKINLLSHNCDMNLGASGAPLLSFTGPDAVIIGINLAEKNFIHDLLRTLHLPTNHNPRTTSNIGVTTDRMMSLYNIISQHYFHSHTRNY